MKLWHVRPGSKPDLCYCTFHTWVILVRFWTSSYLSLIISPIKKAALTWGRPHNSVLVA